jgi:NADH-quinone oxidoreductase subunit G
MAAVADVQLVTITVNGVDLQVPKGQMVVEAVKQLSIDIPIFCYHPRMRPVGMCRMCLVEVATKAPDGSLRKMPKPQTACSLPASDGLVITTDSEALHKDRRGVLEFLLINHPLDCPICDRGGECPLQNNTLFYGPSTSRFVELKRHAPKAFPLSQYVTLDLERCIQCGRCVRFTEEISGDAQLAFRFRGAQMQPSTFQLSDFDSKFSGNVIEICPVGALTSTQYRFRARPWDLQTKPGICTLCSNGCNVYLDYRRERIVRVNGRTNEAINEEWTCDRGKFGHDAFAENRLTTPQVRRGSDLVEAEWPEAYAEALGALEAPGNALAALAGGENSCEDYALLAQLMRDELGSDHLDHRYEVSLPEAAERETFSSAGFRIEDLERAPTVLVFGTSLADEEPIVYLRLRKGWFQTGTRIVVASAEPTDVDSFAHTVLRYRPGTEAAVADALAGRLDAVAATSQTGVPAERFAQAREILVDPTVITTRGLWSAPTGPAAARALRDWAGERMFTLARRANEEGASRAGIWPVRGGADTHGILAACARGEIETLWLMGVDLFAQGLPAAVVTAALEATPNVIVQDWRRTEATMYATLVLPMAAPPEMDGSYINVDRQLQTMDAVLAPPGKAKPAWRAISELLVRRKPRTPFFSAREVREALLDLNGLRTG